MAEGTGKGEEKLTRRLVFFLIAVLVVLLAAYFVVISHNDRSHTQGKPSTTLISPPRSSEGNPPSVPPSDPNPH